MDLTWVLEVCKAYSAMGTAIQEQLQDIATGESLDDQNPNALRVIGADFLGRIAEGTEEKLQEELMTLKTKIDEYLAEIEEDDEAF